MIYSDYWYQKRLKLSLNVMTGAMTGARPAARRRRVHVASRTTHTHNEPERGPRPASYRAVRRRGRREYR